MKPSKSILTIPLCIAVFLLVFFLTGRYGWKSGGFNACESAGIDQVNEEENQVRIHGFYPGSFPQGFLGCHAEQVDDTTGRSPLPPVHTMIRLYRRNYNE